MLLAGQVADVTPGVDQRALQRRVAEAIAQRGGVLDLDEIQRAARLLRDRLAQPLQHRRARVQSGDRMATVAAALALERARAAHAAFHRRDQVPRPHRLGQEIVGARSEEHTSELQSLMRISYAVFCLQKKKTYQHDYLNKRCLS